MTADRYLEMQSQLGQEPVEEDIPPSWEDFPDIVIDAVNTFNQLGDRVYPDIGYVGKDFTNFNFLLNKFGIEKHQEEYIFDIILWLDARQVKISQDRIKAEHDKIKNNHNLNIFYLQV